MKRMLLAAVVGACALAGCSSLNSTYVGEAASGTKFEGMPIVVQRPKYLKVTYKQVTYLAVAKRTVAVTGAAGAAGATTTSEAVMLGGERTVDEIATEVVNVGEVFTLDLKRPAAGNTDYAVEFDSNSQYPKKIGAKIEDKTIEAVAKAAGDLLDKFRPAAAQPADVVDVVKVAERTVKIELRSLDNPARVYQVFP